VRDNVGYHLDTADLPYLPRDLQDLGYATAAAVSAAVLDGRLGLAEGFDLAKTASPPPAVVAAEDAGALGQIVQKGPQAHLPARLAPQRSRPRFRLLAQQASLTA
jgi:hypothetical protein